MRSIETKEIRCSNLELLRIVAMFLVLIVHANFFSIGEPKLDDILNSPGLSFTRFFIEACAIICVNVFVLISGWFGIKPKLSRFFDFSFQVIFISAILYFVFGSYKRSLGEWLTIILGFQYWFVKAYIILYVLSPLLNAFIEKSSKKQFGLFLISFYLIQTIYGWYLGDADWFNKGFSPLSFIGLYLLARYIRLYKPVNLRPSKWFLLYLLSILVITIWAYIGVRMGHDVIIYVYAYDSPLVVVTSICFFMIFAEMKINTSLIINSIAVSSFSVYLFHYHECILHNYYTDIIKNWYLTENVYTFLAYTLGWVITIFIISILVDKIRIIFWNSLRNGYNSLIK